MTSKVYVFELSNARPNIHLINHRKPIKISDAFVTRSELKIIYHSQKNFLDIFLELVEIVVDRFQISVPKIAKVIKSIEDSKKRMGYSDTV